MKLSSLYGISALVIGAIYFGIAVAVNGLSHWEYLPAFLGGAFGIGLVLALIPTAIFSVVQKRRIKQ